MFLGAYWNQPVCRSVCPCVYVSVCVQDTSFCQRAGGGIMTHLVTALVRLWKTGFMVTEKWSLWSNEKMK